MPLTLITLGILDIIQIDMIGVGFANILELWNL